MPIKYHVIDVRRDGIWESCQPAEHHEPSDVPSEPSTIHDEQQPVSAAENSTSDVEKLQAVQDTHQLPVATAVTQVSLEVGVEVGDSECKEVIEATDIRFDSVQLDTMDKSQSQYLQTMSATIWNDPVNFLHKRIDAALINSFIDRPHQPYDAFHFPVTNGRQFMPSWFHSCMPDGSKVTRKWLTYSAAQDKAYCLNCILFGGPNASKLWTASGFSGWIHGHGVRDIIAHESTDQRRFAEIAYVQWITNSRVDRVIAEHMKSVIDQNRRVVFVAIKALQYLATEMIAIRGHNSNEGKFMNLFKLLAQYDPSAAGYLESLESIRSRPTRNKPEVNFLSPLNIRRLLTVMKLLLV